MAFLVSPLVLLGKGIAKGISAIPHVNFPDISRKTKDRLTTIGYYTSIGFLISIVTTAIILGILKFGIIHVLFWIGVIAGVVGGIIGLVFLIAFIHERYESWRYDHPKKERPNLLVEFIKAKKNKHCPLVQWEE